MKRIEEERDYNQEDKLGAITELHVRENGQDKRHGRRGSEEEDNWCINYIYDISCLSRQILESSEAKHIQILTDDL